MGRGNQQRRTNNSNKRERLPPAESAEELSSSLNGLSLNDKDNKSPFPIPLAMWVRYTSSIKGLSLTSIGL